SSYGNRGKGKGWRGYNNSNNNNYGNYYNKNKNYRYGNWYDDKRGDKRSNEDQSGSPQPLKVPKHGCLALDDLEGILKATDSPDPEVSVEAPRTFSDMVTYFVPRLCRVGAALQPRGCRHEAFIAMAAQKAENGQPRLDEALNHMARSAQEDHPLSFSPGLPDTLVAAIEFLKRSDPVEVSEQRKAATKFWSQRARCLAEAADLIASKMPESVRGIAGHINIPLFKEMLEASNYCDHKLADDLVSGLPLSGSFGPFKGTFRSVPEHLRRAPSEDIDDLLRRGPERGRELAGRVEKEHSPHTEKLWQSAIKERQAGSMAGPYSIAEIEEMFDGYVSSRRFGVQQGEKLRPCDDFRRSKLNASMCFMSKVSFPSPDATVATARMVASACGTTDLSFWKSDHSSAYRQVPCHPDSYKMT
ncbi:hypothetical protein FOL47_002932, partial [Perkinsus chesapeaki]